LKSLPDPKRDYEPEIDGLRALAVISVMLFHLGVPGFSGGFVGVDVFFVISGFLITRLIYREARVGEFSFAKFYARRARRILPALIVTLAVTAIAGALIAAPAHFQSLLRSLIYATFGVSNVYFWQESGYFASDAIATPLLHTWTLGVEEQFYLLWPAALLVLVRYHSRFVLIAAVVVVGALSLGAADYAIDRGHATAAFFLMPFRIVEFAIGAFLVWTARGASDRWKELSCVAGFAAVAAAVYFYTPETRFPGLTALLPCIGAALLIYGGSANYAGLALRNGAAVWIGRRSYSLYLVHWPLISLFYLSTLRTPSFPQMAGLALAAVVISALMYEFVEQPCRYGRPATPPLMVLRVAAASVAILFGASIAGLVAESSATHMRFDTAPVDALKIKRFRILREKCRTRGWDHCQEVIPGKLNILVVGDSMATDAYNALHVVLPEANLVFSSLPGCPPYSKMEDLLPANWPNRLDCIELNRKRFASGFLKPFDMIVVDVLYD
jgi:peptidoglycan/LPS O-acetylase OafA/YrhL